MDNVSNCVDVQFLHLVVWNLVVLLVVVVVHLQVHPHVVPLLYLLLLLHRHQFPFLLQQPHQWAQPFEPYFPTTVVSFATRRFDPSKDDLDAGAGDHNSMLGYARRIIDHCGPVGMLKRQLRRQSDGYTCGCDEDAVVKECSSTRVTRETR